MVFTNKYTKILIDRFPRFSKCSFLLQVIRIYGDDKDGINAHAVLSSLSDYITEVLAKDTTLSDEEREIYTFVDKYRANFSNYSENSVEVELDNAICTCFLENLINRNSAGSYDFRRILPYLTEKSREYCKEWDRFTGVRSPGLWSDQEWQEANHN